jgi:hypothetical protein
MPPADDAAPPPTPQTLELTLAAGDTEGRVTLRITQRGHTPLTVVVPDRPDQVEWFSPDSARLTDPFLRVMWTAWRTDDGNTMHSGHQAALAFTRHVTLGPDDATRATLDLKPALAGVLLRDGERTAWCARAWIVGGVHPLPSNIVCWPDPSRE